VVTRLDPSAALRGVMQRAGARGFGRACGLLGIRPSEAAPDVPDGGGFLSS